MGTYFLQVGFVRYCLVSRELCWCLGLMMKSVEDCNGKSSWSRLEMMQVGNFGGNLVEVLMLNSPLLGDCSLLLKGYLMGYGRKVVNSGRKIERFLGILGECTFRMLCLGLRQFDNLMAFGPALRVLWGCSVRKLGLEMSRQKQGGLKVEGLSLCYKVGKLLNALQSGSMGYDSRYFLRDRSNCLKKFFHLYVNPE